MPIQHIYELFVLDGQDFVKEAYRNLLNREPDEHGMAYYLARLAMGDSKTSIVAQKTRSQEYKAYDREIKGLKKLINEESRKRNQMVAWFRRRGRFEIILLNSEKPTFIKYNSRSQL